MGYYEDSFRKKLYIRINLGHLETLHNKNQHFCINFRNFVSHDSITHEVGS